MKKLLSLLMAAMLLPFALGALELEPNQRIMGHYTTDSVNATGWSNPKLVGIATVATDITPDEVAVFSGGKIVAFRVGLSLAAPISRVFVIPIDTEGKLLNDQMTEWPCQASSKGWNMIELATPFDIDLPDGYSLRIGFDYEQATKTTKVLSLVKVGTTYPTLHYLESDGKWLNLVLNNKGNLSLQCIVEKESYSPYILRVDGIVARENIKIGDDLPFSFNTRNVGDGQVLAGQATYEVAIDGNVMLTMTNPADLSTSNVTMSGTISTAGLDAGPHTLTITATAVNGVPLDKPATASKAFNTFEFGYSRQMRLVEQFTSTGCTYCPQGTANIQNLCNMRNDIAWVSIHENMGNTDPFRTAQTDSITDMEGIDGFPEGSFDRTAGISSPNSVYAVLTGLSANTMSSFLDYIENNPSWATVNINSNFDSAARQATITIDGELVPNYENIMGTDSKLTVYITEDGLVAPQVSGGNDYVHNNVLRQALVSVKGVDLNKNGNSYKNVFNVTIPDEWNADKLNIVAFISRPLRSNALTDIYVTNANKRKFGEFDEPTFIPGDVDGDGKVGIDDIATIIDLLLNDSDKPQSADVDGDGKVNIDDLASLIDMILNGN